MGRIKHKWIFVLGIGLAVGALTVAGRYLPGDWVALAQSAAVWLVPVYFVGAWFASRGRAIVMSICCLVTTFLAYYLISVAVSGEMLIVSSTQLIWLGCALFGGMLYGFAGHLWRHTRGLRQSLGAAMLPAVFFAEGIMMLLHVPQYKTNVLVPVAAIGVGFVLLLVLGHGAKEERERERTSRWFWLRARIYCLLLALPITGFGLVGYSVLWSILQAQI